MNSNRASLSVCNAAGRVLLAFIFLDGLITQIGLSIGRNIIETNPAAVVLFDAVGVLVGAATITLFLFGLAVALLRSTHTAIQTGHPIGHALTVSVVGVVVCYGYVVLSNFIFVFGGSPLPSPTDIASILL